VTNVIRHLIYLLLVIAPCVGLAQGQTRGENIFSAKDNLVVDEIIITTSPQNTAGTRTELTPGKSLSSRSPSARTKFDNGIELQSASGREEREVPFQFGRAFMLGEFKACPQLVNGTTKIPTQIDVKSRYPDGSIRFAIVSLVVPQVSPSAPLKLTFVETTLCPAPVFSKAAYLKSVGEFDAQIIAGGRSASAREMVQMGHYKVWTHGPIVTTLIVADHKTKKFDIGSNPNSVVRPSFELQVWARAGAKKVRFIGETSDTEKVSNDTYDLELKLGNPVASVYRKQSLTQNHSSRWSKVFWANPPPELNVNWNVAYLAATKALPNYDAEITLSASTEAKIVSDWGASAKDIQEPGFWTKNMPAAGGRADLGPFTKWSVAWLYSGSAQLRKVALGTADLAGAWPMHLREGSTTRKLTRAQNGRDAMGLPVLFYSRPSLARPGCNGYGWTYILAADRIKHFGSLDDQGWFPDTAHQPQPFFIPYLLTGEHFYLEQLQFWAGFSAQVCGAFGTSVPEKSDSGQCWARSVNYQYAGRDNQIRAQAWALRVIAEAAWATPNTSEDTDNLDLGKDLASIVEDKVVMEEGLRGISRDKNFMRADWKWANTGKGDCNHNIRAGLGELRIWDQNTGYPAGSTYSKAEAGWQIGFMMYALTRASELGSPTDNLRTWLAPFFTKQVTASGANPYHLADYVFPTVGTNGKVFNSWTAIDAAIGKPYDGQRLWESDGSTKSLDQGYGTIAISALANSYGTPDAESAWKSFGWLQYQRWGWERDPKWALLPRESVRN
jgi:hypothetical protein